MALCGSLRGASGGHSAGLWLPVCGSCGGALTVYLDVRRGSDCGVTAGHLSGQVGTR